MLNLQVDVHLQGVLTIILIYASRKGVAWVIGWGLILEYRISGSAVARGISPNLVVTDLDGNLLLQVGSTGEDGLHDGNFDDATFNRPQGLAYNAKTKVLYAADTENHALREVDFVSEVVRPLAGNGTKGRDCSGGGKGNAQLLNSPWDVCFHPVNDKVYIAMAGQHQIWEHNILDEITRTFSGDGYERNLNGSRDGVHWGIQNGLNLSRSTVIYLKHNDMASI